MKKLTVVMGLMMMASTVWAADPCISKGGQIESGAVGRGLVRLCTFQESPGLFSGIGYNDLVLSSQGKKALSVKVFLAKKDPSAPSQGTAVCKLVKASVVQWTKGDNAISLCMFKDGSVIDAFTLSMGSKLTKKLAAALK